MQGQCKIEKTMQPSFIFFVRGMVVKFLLTALTVQFKSTRNWIAKTCSETKAFDDILIKIIIVLICLVFRDKLKHEPHPGVFDKTPRPFHVLISFNEPSECLVC